MSRKAPGHEWTLAPVEPSVLALHNSSLNPFSSTGPVLDATPGTSLPKSDGVRSRGAARAASGVSGSFCRRMKTPPRPLPTPSSPFLLTNHPLNARHVLEVLPIHTSLNFWSKGVVCGRLESDWSVAALLEGAGRVHRPPIFFIFPTSPHSLTHSQTTSRVWMGPSSTQSVFVACRPGLWVGREGLSIIHRPDLIFTSDLLDGGKPYTDPSSSPRFPFAFLLGRSASRTFPRRRPDTVPRDLRSRSAFVVPLALTCLWVAATSSPLLDFELTVSHRRPSTTFLALSNRYLASTFKIDMSSASNTNNVSKAITSGSEKGVFSLPKGSSPLPLPSFYPICASLTHPFLNRTFGSSQACPQGQVVRQGGATFSLFCHFVCPDLGVC